MERNYTNSPAPAFDAVEDVKFWLGDKYSTITKTLAQVKDCEEFAFYASFVGVHGFPVRAWYESINGGGTWKEFAT